MNRKIFSTSKVVLIFAILVMNKSTALSDVKEDVEIIMEQLRSIKPANYDLVLSAPLSDVLDALGNYSKETNEHTRMYALGVALEIAEKKPELGIQRQVVKFILDFIHPDLSSSADRSAVGNLLSFPPKAFTEESKKIVHQLFMQTDPSRGTALLTGWVHNESAKDRLGELAKEEIDRTNVGWFGMSNWAAHLALARMGVESEVKFCIKQVQKTDDDVMRVTRLLKDLTYIGKPATVEVLVEHLFSDQRLPSVRVGDNGMKGAHYALDLLAHLVVDFPIEIKRMAYTDERIETARRWVKSQDHLKIRNQSEVSQP